MEERPLNEAERVLVARLEAFDDAVRSGTDVSNLATELSELPPAARARFNRAQLSLRCFRRVRPLPSPNQSPRSQPLASPFRLTGTGLAETTEREATDLLYRRMRIVFTILALCMLYMVWVFLSGLMSDYYGAEVGYIAPRAVYGNDRGFLLVAVTLSMSASAVLLWVRVPLGDLRLRQLETWNFLLLCLFFSNWEYGLFTMKPSGGFVTPGHHGAWLLYALTETQLIWISLLATTGVVIPKQTRRCAWMIAVVIVAAVGSLLAAAHVEPMVAHALPALLADLLAATIGSGVIGLVSIHKLRALEKAAREAREMGEYRLKELLGSGGMGEVWRAEHRLLKRPCAVKLIRPERAGDPEAVRRFEREVQATARLRHPNTIAVFDYGTTADGTLYYVMEYLPGLSLDRLVARYGPLPPDRVVHLLRQVCGSLREAHEAGLVHRDLKPANVFVCDAGPADRAKLLDFGLVRSANPLALSADLTQEGRLIGTPGYMTPEQIEGRPVDARSDLYSLGAVAYFALTGREPFEAESAMRTLLGHLHDSPPSLRAIRPDVSAALEAVVLRCLSKNPSDRPDSAAELERVLGQCFGGAWTEDDATAWWRSVATHALER